MKSDELDDGLFVTCIKLLVCFGAILGWVFVAETYYGIKWLKERCRRG